MNINESGLCSAMKRSWKNGYYVLPVKTEEDMVLTISGDGWTVTVSGKRIPRKVLGLLVEHAGEIPDKPIEIKKKTDNQVVLPDVVKGMFDIANNPEIEQEWAEPTTLTYEGRRVFQREDGRIVCISQELLDIVESWETEQAMIFGGGISAWYAAGVTVMVVCNGGIPSEAANYLSGFAWCRMAAEDRATAAEEPEEEGEDQECMEEAE